MNSKNKIDYRETGKRWLKSLKRAWYAAAIALALTSCWESQPGTWSRFSWAEWDYKSWKTTELLEENKTEIEQLIENYNYYYDEAIRHKKNLAQLQANGADAATIRRERERIKELIIEINKTSEAINKAEDETIDLQKYYQRGKRKAATSDSGDINQLRLPTRRNFEEIQWYNIPE